MLLDCEIVNCVRKRIDKSKKIPNFSDYLILYNVGLIWSKKRGKFVGNKGQDGYYRITLYGDNGKKTTGQLHRFIYEAVYGPIPSGMEVNHIDEDKSNNSIFNLNLMTHKQNSNWGTRNERMGKARSKPVGAYIGEELKFTFPSIAEANRNGFNSGHISLCCRGEQKTHKGYKWRYIET